MMNWKVLPKISRDKALKLKSYDGILAQLLFNRGIKDSKSAKSYLEPSIGQLYKPGKLFDVKSAAKRVEEAIKKKEKIFIHGDYDVDGMTSTALLWDYLYRKRKADVTPYMPSRVDEGYGLSKESVSKIIDKGAQLIISVDCGVRDFELIDDTKDVDFIIIDHHQPGEKITKRGVVVHPMHPKGKYPYEFISGCAVTWKFICAMEEFRSSKKFSFKDIPGIEYVCLSTVTDMMPLKDENRVYVKLGLDGIHKKPSIGLEKIIQSSQLEKESIDTYHLGFVIGPRFNASGRIGDPMDGVRLLVTQDENVAEKIAGKLSRLNKKRQDMTDQVFSEVKEITDASKDDFLYFAQKDGWSEGIIGLAAGKILEEVYRPVVVATGDGEVVRGSARSIVDFNITEAIENFSDILMKYGGHAQAAGFTIKKKNLKKLEDGLKKLAKEKLKNAKLEKEIKVDMEIEASDIDWDLVEIVDKLKPFGIGNRRPLFLVKDVVVISSNPMGDNKHMRFTIKDEKSDFISCVFFNARGWIEKLKPGTIVDIVGMPQANIWNGEENLQFNVSDVKISK